MELENVVAVGRTGSLPDTGLVALDSAARAGRGLQLPDSCLR